MQRFASNTLVALRVSIPGTSVNECCSKTFQFFIASLVYPIEGDQRLMDDIWLHEVKSMEVLSESYPQMALNLWVIKIYGVSDPIQLVSAVLAWVGLIKIVADRYCFIRNGQDIGMASWGFVQSFLDLIGPLLSGFFGYLISLSEDCMPAWVLLMGPLLTHPFLFWIVQIVNHKKHTPKTKSTSRHYSVYACTQMIIGMLRMYTFFIVSKNQLINMSHNCPMLLGPNMTVVW